MEPNPQSPENSPPANQPQQSEAELFSVASETAAKHGADGTGTIPNTEQPKRRGRPPIHGRYSKAFGSDGKKPVPFSGGPIPSRETPQDEVVDDSGNPPGVPPDLLCDFARELCGIVEEGAQGVLRTKQASLRLHLPEADALIESCAMGEGRKDFVAKLAPHVAQEWGIQSNISPTAAVLVVFADLGRKWLQSIRALESAARAQQPKPSPHATPS